MNIYEIEPVAKERVLSEQNKGDLVIGQLRFVFSQAGVRNKNNRVYPEHILKREVKKFRQRLKDENVAGRMEHSRVGIAELDKISHVITDVEYDPIEKKGVATADILATSKGKDLRVLLKSNIRLGASTVGSGSINSDGIVQDDFELTQVDLVSNPSFGSITQVSAANLTESSNQQVNEIIKKKTHSFFIEAKRAGYTKTFEQYQMDLNKPSGNLTAEERKIIGE
jgi:hypothetical protein